jgi:hypothetical protein
MFRYEDWSNPMMEVEIFCKALLQFYQTARFYTTEDCNLQSHSLKNIKFSNFLWFASFLLFSYATFLYCKIYTRVFFFKLSSWLPILSLLRQFNKFASEIDINVQSVTSVQYETFSFCIQKIPFCILNRKVSQHLLKDWRLNQILRVYKHEEHIIYLTLRQLKRKHRNVWWVCIISVHAVLIMDMFRFSFQSDWHVIHVLWVITAALIRIP